MTNVFRLASYQSDTVHLACRRCERRGRYSKTVLFGRHGADIPLPDLCNAIAQCERARAPGDACGVYFVDLANPSSATRP